MRSAFFRIVALQSTLACAAGGVSSTQLGAASHGPAGDRTDRPPAVASPAPLIVPRNWAPPDIDQTVPPVRSDAVCPLNKVLAEASQHAVDLVENLQSFSATEHIEHVELGKDDKHRNSKSRVFKV